MKSRKKSSFFLLLLPVLPLLSLYSLIYLNGIIPFLGCHSPADPLTTDTACEQSRLRVDSDRAALFNVWKRDKKVKVQT